MEDKQQEIRNSQATGQHFKYFAFISYSSHDTAWGRRVQHTLEHYRMSATLCSQHGWKRHPIKPVFFAPTDIQPGGLSVELQDRLRQSRHLIVICSPHSAQSQWVGREIEFFHSLGRDAQIHFFIVDGVPHSGDPATECFNPVVEQLGMPEILGANIHEHVYRWPWLNRERAYVQLISKLLGVEFDTIWQRHRRLLMQRIAAWTAGLLLVVAALIGVWRSSQPLDVTLQLQEATAPNAYLPPLGPATVVMTLDNESKSDSTAVLSQAATFRNVPRRFIGRQVALRVSCGGLLPLDTVVELRPAMTVALRRDARLFGHVRFRLWNGQKPVPHQPLTVAGRQVQSDANGVVELDIPLAHQRTAYPVTAQTPLSDDSIHMPCGPDDIIQVLLPAVP